MVRVLQLFTGLVLLSCLFTLPAAAADGFDGLPVAAVILKDDLGRPLPDHASLLSLVETRPGAPFSRDEVRKSIAYLYLEGKFRDIRVDAFADGAGVRLEYTLVPVVIVDRIVLRGNRALPSRAIRDALRGVEGRELREELFPDLRTEIQTRYQAEGYYNTRINFRPAPSARPHRSALYVYITEPRQTIIEQVTFKGARAFSPQDLSEAMRNRPGRPLLTNVLLEDDMEALRQMYAERGYPAATAGPVSMSFRGDRASLEVTVDEGPKVSMSFTGTRAYCAGQFPDLLQVGPDGSRNAVLEDACAAHLRGLLLIATEHEVSDAVIESSVENIRKEYRELGYADVKVEVKRTGGPGRLDLVFEVTEGPQVAVDEVRIEGHRVFTDKQVRELMETRESVWSRRRPLREDVLEKDRDLILDQYTAAGYLSAEVRTAVTRTGDGGSAVVALKIAEGRQTLTGDISFEGNAVVSGGELAAVVKSRTAAPFSERLVEEDRYRILALYLARGYLYASVETDRTPAFGNGTAPKDAKGNGTAPEVMHVRFRIAEDRQVTIGKIILRGNVQTRDHIILRELEPKTGEPYNYEQMLKSQQRVYRYGYFGLAKFEPVRPHEKEYVKDMLFTVEERPAGAVEFGVGYGTLDRLRGFAEVSHRNIFGTARHASVRVEGSDILKRAALLVQHPWFLGVRDLESTFLLAWSNTKRINEETREIYYETRKTTASYGVVKTINSLKVSLTYQYEDVENYNVQPAATLNPDDAGYIRISSLTPGVILDKRDDPFNPTTGSVHGLNVKEAMNVIGSKADFTKLTAQTSWFFPLAERRIIALSGRAGVGWPHRETLEVPLHERFYLGGGSTVRGYTQDAVGPSQPDSTGEPIPTGGSSMVQLNAELRLNSAEGSGIVLFTDAGNVWVDQSIRMNDLRASYGAGFRYHTPVGPLRVDYGQKIHRRSGESPGELHFNIGHAF